MWHRKIPIRFLARRKGNPRGIDFNVDGLGGGVISGWIWKPGAPAEKVAIELLADGAVVLDAVANAYRADLAAAGKSDGFCAFSLHVPPDMPEDPEPTLSLRVRGQSEPFHVIGLASVVGAAPKRSGPPARPGDGPAAAAPLPCPPASDQGCGAAEAPSDLFGPRWIRFCGHLDLAVSARAKLRLAVDDGEVWSGEVPFRPEGARRGLVDVRLSFPEPSRPTLARRVKVDSAVLGLSPRSVEAQVDYAGRFAGSVSSIRVRGVKAEATVLFSDAAGLTARPFVRVTDPFDNDVPVSTRSVVARDRGDGIREFEIVIEFSCTPASLEECRFFAMWSAAALPVADTAIRLDGDVPGRLVDPLVDREGDVLIRLDSVSDGIAGGWAKFEDDDERRLLVDLEVDGRVVNSGIAALLRGDVARKFGHSGYHGFAIEVPRGLPHGATIRAAVRWPRAVAPRSFVVGPAEGTRVLARPDPARALARLAQVPARIPGVAGPVDVIVLNSNGASLLDEMFATFRERETFRDVRFIVVDHASTDGSEEVCRRHGAAVQIDFVRRNGNFSFSDSSNFGAACGSGDYLFFLNNDTVFFEPVIGALVERAANPAVAAAGLRLVDVHNKGLDALLPERSDQHLGLFLSSQPGTAMYELRGTSDTAAIARKAIVAPGVTAAAMMMRRQVFEAAGGFDTGFFYGQEDVDLCFRLREAHGAIVCDNALSLGHKRGFSRSRADSSFAATQGRNRRLVQARHGRTVRRLLGEAVLERARWTASPPVIAFLVTDVADNARAGDVFTATELAHELAMRCDAEFRLVMPVDGFFDVTDVDLVVSMRDDFSPFRMRGLGRHCRLIYWVRNWFDRFYEGEHWQHADEIWCASALEAARCAERTGRSARVLPIATNAQRFSEGRYDADYASDYCFTGSYWNVHREIMVHADPTATRRSFRIFGTGWGNSPLKDYWYGAVPYSEMPAVYASTKLVVDDANHVTELSGSVNSRVFDALAAGALPLTNGRLGSEEVFGGRLPVYASAQELTALIERYLTDPAARAALVAELRAEVLEHHTYARRAEAVAGFLRDDTARPSIAIKIGAPSRAVREAWGDHHFAEALRREFCLLGHRAAIFHLDEWQSEAAARCDVVLVLRGLGVATPDPDQLNLMWLISHPDKTSVDELRGYDHVFVASERYAERLRADGVAASTLLQCSDPGRFPLDPQPVADAPEVLFVGNSRGEPRRIVLDAIAAGLDLHIYGEGWAGLVPDAYVRGTHIPNEQLARWYASAGVVLNDHWPDMARHGFLSNRLFDAVSCGAFVVSDRAQGLEAVFGDLVATYETPGQLAELVRHRNDCDVAASRRPAIEEFRQRHSFRQRAEAVLRRIAQAQAGAAQGESEEGGAVGVSRKAA